MKVGFNFEIQLNSPRIVAPRWRPTDLEPHGGVAFGVSGQGHDAERNR
jgi:hypothetical protein